MTPEHLRTPPRVLIVESEPSLGTLWQRHLERHNMVVFRVTTQDEATEFLAEHQVDVIVLNLVLSQGAALAVADYANYRQPGAQVVFVTDTSFFSDGSIWAHATNARALLPAGTPPEDLAAMIEHYSSEQRMAQSS